MKEVIRCVGLKKSFGNLLAVDVDELSVNMGETIAIIGPSGSGKSTFLRCLNCLEEPSGGEIYFKGNLVGQKVDKIRYRERDLMLLRQRLGMVFQNFNLFPHLKAIDNIALGPQRIRGMSAAEAKQHALTYLDMVGLREKQDAYPSQLSGGQQQRIAIARAMAMEPDALLFDEPTSALDPELVGEVLAVMKRLSAQGMTMLVVTHEMSFARNVADRVVFFEGGRICAQGAPSEVLDNPADARMQAFLQKHEF